MHRAGVSPILHAIFGWRTLNKLRGTATTASVEFQWRGEPHDEFGCSFASFQRFARAARARDRATGNFLAVCGSIADRLAQTLRAGGKILLAGNGGSAADAQHVAAEFLSRFAFDRNPLPAIALTTDTSVITAIGNDYGYERLFERQVRGLGRKGDAFIAISTSGRSPNVIAGLKAAREIGLTTIGFSGSGGDMRPLCDLILAVPSAGDGADPADPPRRLSRHLRHR